MGRALRRRHHRYTSALLLHVHTLSNVLMLLSGTIGISTYAAKALGDVVYVELPQPDLQVSAGDPIGAVESVKSASDIMTPISGTIIEANSVLEDTPATINQSPEGDGWLAKIKVSDKTELDKLKTADEYQKFTDEAGDH